MERKKKESNSIKMSINMIYSEIIILNCKRQATIKKHFTRAEERGGGGIKKGLSISLSSLVLS